MSPAGVPGVAPGPLSLVKRLPSHAWEGSGVGPSEPPLSREHEGGAGILPCRRFKGVPYQLFHLTTSSSGLRPPAFGGAVATSSCTGYPNEIAHSLETPSGKCSAALAPSASRISATFELTPAPTLPASYTQPPGLCRSELCLPQAPRPTPQSPQLLLHSPGVWLREP